MLEPKNRNQMDDGTQGAKLDPQAQATDQMKPKDPKAEEGTTSEDELDQ